MPPFSGTRQNLLVPPMTTAWNVSFEEIFRPPAVDVGSLFDYCIKRCSDRLGIDIPRGLVHFLNRVPEFGFVNFWRTGMSSFLLPPVRWLSTLWMEKNVSGPGSSCTGDTFDGGRSGPKGITRIFMQLHLTADLLLCLLFHWHVPLSSRTSDGLSSNLFT